MTDNWPGSPTLVSSQPAHLHPCPQGQLYCVPRQGAGLVLPSVAACEGQGELCAALSSLFLVVTGARDLNTDHSCGRATDTHMALGSGLGPDVTMALGDKQATHISQFLPAFVSSDLPLSSAHEPLCMRPPLVPTICLFNVIALTALHYKALGRPMVVFSHPRSSRTRQA